MLQLSAISGHRDQAERRACELQQQCSSLEASLELAITEAAEWQAAAPAVSPEMATPQRAELLQTEALQSALEGLAEAWYSNCAVLLGAGLPDNSRWAPEVASTPSRSAVYRVPAQVLLGLVSCLCSEPRRPHATEQVS